MNRISLVSFLNSWDDIEALRWLTARTLESELQRIARRSREATTHYKWLLAAYPRRTTRLWLQQFKPPEETGPGYAGSIHNHRYPFQSIILTGGYVNSLYQVSFEPGSLSMYECRLVSSSELPSEATYSMEPSEYHALHQIEEGTQSLVVEFSPNLPESYSVAADERRVVRHVPLEARASGLADISARLRASGAELE